MSYEKLEGHDSGPERLVRRATLLAKGPMTSASSGLLRLLTMAATMMSSVWLYALRSSCNARQHK